MPTDYVPARYKGAEPVQLAPRRGGYRNGDGTKRAGDDALVLKPGETLLIPATELLGETLLVDPTGLASHVERLGVGFAPLPEHAALLRDDLIGVRFIVDGRVRMYEFHEGRADFEALDALEVIEAIDGDAAAPAAASDEPSETSSTAKRARAKNASGADATSESAADAADASDAAQGA